MATSDSDDFESADEELSGHSNSKKTYFNDTSVLGKTWASIDSDSDGDIECIPVQCQNTNTSARNYENFLISSRSAIITNQMGKMSDHNEAPEVKNDKNEKYSNPKDKIDAGQNEKFGKQGRLKKEQKQLGAKKLGMKLGKKVDSNINSKVFESGEKVKINEQTDEHVSLKQELQESLSKENKTINLSENTLQLNEKSEKEPEELNSNLKFKDIFKPDGYEGLDNDVQLPNDFSDDKYQPVLDKLSTLGSKQDSDSDSWSAWGSWGVNSLLNTATAGVSSMTSHVSRGFSLLEETIGAPDPEELVKSEDVITQEKKTDEKESEIDFDYSFGFGNLISSVSNITKLVESTSSRVITGGLDTLETIGKKTMEVLQEGDPGLKKKRAFFSSENDRPILSQILREAKDKADTEEKSLEEKELARKVHFESLFDDYQGLVHLEALEMLSKQCSIKIQQHLVNLDGNDLTALQETLDEVKELCDLGNDEEFDEENNEKSLEDKLKEACEDLGISLSLEKLINVWKEILESSIPACSTETSHSIIFQKAISSVALFTACSVERYHKTAELLLIKEHRSTVNETDSLVQFTKVICSQLDELANLFCNQLNKFNEESVKSVVSSNIKFIIIEATNASSYIQEAFRLLIPILQIGAI